ncbi:MAG: beta-lactamase family protein, partial [Bacteroidia bacterium]|nr:beta-lactamase family protein [Bacteroidia bacterium]
MDKTEFRYYYKKLNNFFEASLLNSGFNGGLLVAKNGAIIYERYSGLADLRKKDSITASTPFHVASSGKPFTAMAILRMVQENKLSLDDSLSKFFPGLPYPGITVKMLLNHRSGLPNYVYFVPNSDWDKNKNVTNNDVLNMLYTDQPTRSYPPGRRYSYSNTNFVLLALIIEKISGEKFPEYMKKNIFDPLQMRNTFVFTPSDSERATPSFNYNRSYYQNDFLDETYGDKNLYTTPRDLLKFDQALYTDQFIGKPLLDSAFTPFSNETKSIHNYGLGWHLLMMPDGKTVVYHYGRWHGFNAAFARLINEKATIIILGNKFSKNIYNAARLCYEIFGDYGMNKPNEEDE